MKKTEPLSLRAFSYTRLCVVFVVVLATLFAFVGPLAAQTAFARKADASSESAISPQTRQLIAPVATMIDANTFFVGHVDLAQIDPETAAAHWKISAAEVVQKLRSNKALAEYLSEDELAEAMQYFTEGLDIGTRAVQAKLDEMRSLGCREIYVLANSKIMTVSAVQVVCLAPAKNLAKLEKTLVLPEQAEFGWVFQHDGDKLIANLIAPFSTTSMNDANVGNRVAFQHRLIRPTLRPELAAGLERVANAPVKLVFAPDGVLRGLTQMFPMAPHMYYSPDMTSFLAYPNMKVIEEGMRWLAIGFDPSRPVLAVTIQSKSPEAAQDLVDMVIRQKVVVSAMESTGRRSYNRYGYDNRAERLSSTLDFAMLFLPEVRGDQLQLVIDEKRLSDTTELITNTYTNVILPSRDSSQKMQCANNMKQIMMALHNYHDVNRAFPAPYTTDKNGKPLHSWRVTLLPYLEQTAIYEQMMQYRDEPWDSENNKQFHNINIPAYQCPAAKNQKPGMTNYSVVVGKVDAEQARKLGLRGPCATAFPEPNKWYSFGFMSDGASNTIGIVERKEPVCWMDPSQEVTLEEAIKLYQTEQAKVGSAHKGGFFIGVCDGSVHFWDEAQRTLEQWKAGLTANGGESVSLY